VTTPHPLGRRLEPNHDPKSRAFQAFTAGALTKTRHRLYGQPLDQGDLGSCTGNAAAHLLNTAPFHIPRHRLYYEPAAVLFYSQATQIDPFDGQYPPEDTGSDGLTWSTWLVVAVTVAAAATVLAGVVRRGAGILEPLGAIAVLLTATSLSLWATGTDTTAVDGADWAHAAISVVAYVLLAVALVALGTVRDHQALTWMAMAGLVVFTTFQSFAVFAPIVTGAWLFVVLGTIFLGTGFLFDRARRELVQALDVRELGVVVGHAAELNESHGE